MNSRRDSIVIPDMRVIIYFRNKIIRWFEKNKRSFPWRETKDPLKVLIAEMMLRRTRADQVKRVYERFFSEYPDVKAIANANKKKLEKILSPLGLKWRFSAFSLVAREIKKKYKYKIPSTRKELISLPGVGDYVAGAVLSVAFNKREWIVDTNIVRLIKRYFGIKTSKEGRRDRHVIEISKMYSSGRNPRDANLAILDFSALVCVPGKPDCMFCPLSKSCHYFTIVCSPHTAFSC